MALKWHFETIKWHLFGIFADMIWHFTLREIWQRWSPDTVEKIICEFSIFVPQFGYSVELLHVWERKWANK